MGESDRYGEYKQQKEPGRRFLLNDTGNALMNLLIINIVFFLILTFIQMGYAVSDKPLTNFYEQVLQWFSLPASLRSLSERPWTILSYMFSDISIMRLLVNMIWLWGFGSIMQSVSANDKIIPVYIYGAVVAGIVFIITNYAVPYLRPGIPGCSLLGANAAVMAVAGAATALAPQHRFFEQLWGGIPIWVLLAIFILIDIAGLPTYNAAHVLAHLSAVGSGIGFVYLLRRGTDAGAWMHKFYHWFMNLFNPNSRGHDTSLKEHVFYETGSRKPFSKSPNITQRRVDEILDKINQKGYQSLTEEEKSILKKAADDNEL
ncbi:MAG: rhomboid family intramembrane serine protease [Ferruginibacter sp.]